jgi:NADH:ubiquinone oxidoreductase subunit 5 (subunit L)/multisubunit Na+/H+ antiporter MnhA subunit
MLGLDQVLVSGKALILIPAALIGFAGLTKAAQMPFSSWLVGAMVAPTPVSALLHSSTMVKAGVYILVRFAPVFQGTVVGYTLAFVGAFTFIIASGIAISQTNAKRVLAYSTIANLGLIVACAGIGTAEAIWAAILLIIFHAISKSLMFLSVGTVEHRIKSREIEDMNGLIVRMPRIAAHLEISMPNGARNMPAIPITIIAAIRGIRTIRPFMSSISRLLIRCSTVPTERNMSDFEIAWKMIRRIAAQIASAVPIPAQATTRPRFAIVEYASTLFAFVWEMAIPEAMRKVNAPTNARV